MGRAVGGRLTKNQCRVILRGKTRPKGGEWEDDCVVNRFAVGFAARGEKRAGWGVKGRCDERNHERRKGGKSKTTELIAGKKLANVRRMADPAGGITGCDRK